MFKRYIWLVIATVFFISNLVMGSATAAELDRETRTLPLNEQGDTFVISLEQVAQGRKQFNYACATCHVQGITKTNPSVGLEPEALEGAYPNRNNLEALVDYLHNPTTYDGLVEISELHPSTKSTDIFPKMRSFTEDDIVAVSGYILLQPKVLGGQWGGGKARYSAPD
ncbi:MAG: photosystem II cytochrome c-550 [Cyanobacteria bacterium P01_G01_bin.38]